MSDSPGAAIVREANRASMLLDPPPHKRPQAFAPERQARVASIDPQEFGRLEAEVAALRRDQDRLVGLMTKLDDKLDSIEAKLSEAKGGWRALMLIGGASAALGGTVMGVLQKLFKVVA